MFNDNLRCKVHALLFFKYKIASEDFPVLTIGSGTTPIMKCLICGNENNKPVCRGCETEDNLNAVLDELLLYKNSETANEKLKNYVLSFESWSHMADEVLRLCSLYSRLKIDFCYYIDCAYKYKGKDFRLGFIEKAQKYLKNPTKDKSKTIDLLRDLSKSYSAEYDFYRAIDICNLLLGPDYLYLNAYLLKAENLVKIRKLDKAIELLEAAKKDISENKKACQYKDEEESLKGEKLLGLFQKAIEEYREKQIKGYVYIPATAEGKDKLKSFLENEGRYRENQVIKEQKEDNFNTFVCFDFETTGVGNYDKITEIGAVKVRNGKIVEYFSELVNPKRKIPEEVTEITGITNEMVKDKETIYDILPKFLTFAGDDILVAHNARFDCRFLLKEAEKLGLEIKNPVLDTMALARKKLPRMNSYKLTSLVQHFGIEQREAHRSSCDAEATAKLYFKLKELNKWG